MPCLQKIIKSAIADPNDKSHTPQKLECPCPFDGHDRYEPFKPTNFLECAKNHNMRQKDLEENCFVAGALWSVFFMTGHH